jgi:hypothetical protein
MAAGFPALPTFQDGSETAVCAGAVDPNAKAKPRTASRVVAARDVGFYAYFTVFSSGSRTAPARNRSGALGTAIHCTKRGTRCLPVYFGLILVILLPWMPSPAINPFWPKINA